MNFGDAWSHLLGACDKETTFGILDEFYKKGGNFIDTANMYMNGESEVWLGEWMEVRGVREEIVLATKYVYTSKLPDMVKEGTIMSNFGGGNKKSLRLSLAQSLERLKTDYVDILYVHGWDGVVTVPELMRSLDDVVRQGKVLYLGVSNAPAWKVVMANEYARRHGLSGGFVVYEGMWNAVARDIERDVLPMCKEEGLGLTVWDAMGGGKFKTEREKEVLGGRAGWDASGKGMDVYKKVGRVLEKMAREKGTNPSSLAMRYVMLKVSTSGMEGRMLELTLIVGSLRLSNRWREKS